MKTLDITLDLETCALCPTAAVMSIGAVAWDMYNEDTPFFGDEEFCAHIDMRSMLVNGFTVDPQTLEWWSAQSDEAKKAVLADDTDYDADVPCRDIATAVKDLFAWIKQEKEAHGADSVNLWCQGSDFDIAILRNICHKIGIGIPVPYTNFRDHRSVFLESVRDICNATGAEFRQEDAYKMVDDYADEAKGAPHDPIFDCKRSIYSTWQIKKHKATLPQIFNS